MKRNIVVSLLLVLLMIFVVSCEEPKHEHTLEKVEAVAATCTEEGMKEYYQCSVCKQTFADKEAKTEVKELATLKTEKDPANHTDVKKVDAVESKCTVNGTVEHWHCEGCGKNYSDEKCDNELKSIEAPLKAHATVLVNAVAATCAEEGMQEYYQCSVCNKTFADKEAKTEVKNLATLKTEKDPANHSKVNKVDAVAATCVEEGMKEYYQCSGCKKNFIDAEAKTEVKDLATLKTDKDPANHSKVEKVEAVESCIFNGTVEHWHCKGCKKNYSDEAYKNELESLVAPLIVHEAGDGVETSETYTVGGIQFPIYKCEHDVFYLDDACEFRLYKDYLDAIGLAVAEKDGTFNAVFVDGYMRLNHVGEKAVYGYGKVGVYFYGKEGKFYYSRVGLNESGDGDTSAFDYTANKELSFNIVKNEDGTLSISATATKKPFEEITSISINPTPKEDKSDIIMMTTTGGEQWTGFRYYENPLAGSWQDLDGYVLTISDLNGDKNIQYNLDGTDYYAFPLIDSPENNQGTLFVAWDGNGARKIFHRNRWIFFSASDLYIKWNSGALRDDLKGFTLYHPVSAE